MPYLITSQCIGCSRCQPVCPTGAVKLNAGQFWIDHSLCNSCQGTYSMPQCVATCPTNGGCIPDTHDYWEHWFSAYNRMVSRLRGATRNPDYWEHWFDTYSQHVATLLTSRPV